jgi:L-lactate dehydrogenase
VVGANTQQQPDEVIGMKIAILGAGRVGSALAHAIVLKELCDHLGHCRPESGEGEGDALDLHHALSFCDRSMTLEAGVIADVRGCDIIVITLSVAVEAAFTSRMQLGAGNVRLFREIIPGLAAANPEAILVIVTNPGGRHDLPGHPAIRLPAVPGWWGSAPWWTPRVFAACCRGPCASIPPTCAPMCWESMGPTSSRCSAMPRREASPLRDTPEHRQLFHQVVEAGFEVYRLKGYTNYAIASATWLVLESIVHDQCRTMPLATHFDEWMGVRDNCFSIPVVVGRPGIVRRLHPNSAPRNSRSSSGSPPICGTASSSC